MNDACDNRKNGKQAGAKQEDKEGKQSKGSGCSEERETDKET